MITVKYWMGTTQLEGKVKTYRGAMKLASKNQNAWPPRYYDAAGVELHDDGQGLAYEDREESGGTITRVYAVHE